MLPSFLDTSPVADVMLSQVIQIDNFLTGTEQEQLLNYVLAKQAEFRPTSTATKENNYRQSLVLHSFKEFSELIMLRVKAVLPEILAQLQLPSFAAKQVEAQITAHNHGDYYKVHNDNGSPEAASRELTYVYYFHRQPKAFTGGELRVYDTKVENNFYVQAESSRLVDPRNNSIVFFLSRYLHEVLPISCPSEAFADSRFTINGWVRK